VPNARTYRYGAPIDMQQMPARSRLYRMGNPELWYIALQSWHTMHAMKTLMDELYSNDDRTWTNIRYVSRTKDRMLLQMFQNSELISRLFLNLKYYVDKKKKES